MTPDEVVEIISSLNIDCTNPVVSPREYVSHDMAVDAEDRELEGQIYKEETYERCGACPNCMFNQVKAEIITDLQDYQKLREKLTVEKIDTEISIVFADYALNGQGSRNLTNDLSQAIVTYLQQPTEPIER